MQFRGFGTILLLIGAVDIFAMLILAIVFFAQTGAFPIQIIIQDSLSWLFLGLGIFLSMDLIREERFNPKRIFLRILQVHQPSLIWLAGFSIIIAVGTGLNPVMLLKTAIYAGLFFSFK